MLLQGATACLQAVLMGIDVVARRKTCKRFNEPGHAHSLTFSCSERKPLLEAGRTKQVLIDSLAAARVRHRFDIWAYVIMPEHMHLLIWPRELEYRISTILAAIKRPVAFQARQAGLTAGPHFWLPGGGFDSNLYEADTIRAEIDYIHKNPVRRGLCQKPEEWRYSSAAFWAGQTDVPLVMDRTVPQI